MHNFLGTSHHCQNHFSTHTQKQQDFEITQQRHFAAHSRLHTAASPKNICN